VTAGRYRHRFFDGVGIQFGNGGNYQRAFASRHFSTIRFDRHSSIKSVSLIQTPPILAVWSPSLSIRL
jgi:hypothetical protein